MGACWADARRAPSAIAMIASDAPNLMPRILCTLLCRQLVGQFRPDDDPGRGTIDDIATARRDIIHAAAYGHRTTACDALEPLGSVGEGEVAVATHHPDAGAAKIGIEACAILGGHGAPALGLLL